MGHKRHPHAMWKDDLNPKTAGKHVKRRVASMRRKRRTLEDRTSGGKTKPHYTRKLQEDNNDAS